MCKRGTSKAYTPNVTIASHNPDTLNHILLHADTFMNEETLQVGGFLCSDITGEEPSDLLILDKKSSSKSAKYKQITELVELATKRHLEEIFQSVAAELDWPVLQTGTLRRSLRNTEEKYAKCEVLKQRFEYVKGHKVAAFELMQELIANDQRPDTAIFERM